tara:strand:+ start:200 stop:487 length:288 start_codon:yes stop_codon:yes gene_type:complete
MLYVFKLPESPKEATIELDKLYRQAVTVMAPDNRRRLSQRRNLLNAHYDQLQLLANGKANTGDKEWIEVAERITLDKKVLQGVKDLMQVEGVQLY